MKNFVLLVPFVAKLKAPMNPRLGIYILLTFFLVVSLLLVSSSAVSDEPASELRPGCG